MVILNKIYTRTGDAGETSIGDGSRVSKMDPRVTAGGSIDETNCCIGLAVSCAEATGQNDLLNLLQQWLFDLGADVSCPFQPDAEEDHCPRINHRHVSRLEAEIDRCNEILQPLQSFILPGGNAAAAHLHLARSVCRRAEVDLLRLSQSTTINPVTLIFLNRLSDLLFVLARVGNDNGAADVLWKPGCIP